MDARVGQVQFAGDALVYEDFAVRIQNAYDVGGSTRLVLVEGAKRRTLLKMGTGVDAEDEPVTARLDWAVSASGLLLQDSATTYFAAGPEEYTEIRGGPLRGPYRQLAECEIGTEPLRHPVTVSGDRGAYHLDCNDSPGVQVRNLVQPQAPPEAAVPGHGNVALAGPHLSAERTKTSVVVTDTRDGRDLYEATGLKSTESGIIHSLQDDGKLAAHLPSGKHTCTLAWFSPEEPRPHTVGDAHCYTSVLIAGDRIAYFRTRENRQQLVVHDLAGGETVVARSPRGVSTLGSLAFDGTRTAYTVERCRGRALLLRAAVAGPTKEDTAPLGCPVTVLSRSLRAGGSARTERTVALPLRCPRGCTGRASVGESSIGQPFGRGPGSGRVTLYLDDPTAERLRKRGTARVAVRMTTYDRAGREAERRLTLTVRG